MPDEKTEEGWGFPGRSKKAHYFVNATSLYRKWGFYFGPLERNIKVKEQKDRK